MTEETFTCDRCGQSFPKRQMKEAFRQDGNDRTRLELCPTCLDEVMNEAGTVQGIAGEEKRAAIRVDAGPGADEMAERASFGDRS
jgi:NAD-dependent SIR2 family protein deacetylase